MGKVLKIREVGDPILNKISDEVDIENINEEVKDMDYLFGYKISDS